MEKQKLESLIIDYIDNKLNSVDRQKVEQELVNNADAYKLYEELKEVMHLMDRSARLEPTAKLRNGFEEMLKQETNSLKETRTIFFQPVFYRAAAAFALVVISGFIGYWISQQQKQDREFAAMREEMEKTRREVMAMLKNDQSASQRIQGVTVAMSINTADNQIVQALVKTLNQDPNTNVRLAALEALSKFHHEPLVRKELIQALAQQKDPVVQIALIQLMVKMKEKSVVNDLQRMIDDDKTMKAVKDEAYSGLMQLS